MHHKDSEKPDEPVFVFINVLFHFTIAFGGAVTPSLPFIIVLYCYTLVA